MLLTVYRMVVYSECSTQSFLDRLRSFSTAALDCNMATPGDICKTLIVLFLSILLHGVSIRLPVDICVDSGLVVLPDKTATANGACVLPMCSQLVEADCLSFVEACHAFCIS